MFKDLKNGIKCDIAVIGGGPAGLASALAARKKGAEVVVMERNFELGGILNQCIHNGFGLEYYGKDMTGPEFAQCQREELQTSGIRVIKNTFVTHLNRDRTLAAVNEAGLLHVDAKSIILAMGCREKTRDAILLPGARTAGIYTAGQVQYYVNIANCIPGKRFVILGSGDIGLIMARRLTLEGMDVLGVYEIMPEPGGLRRNVKNCLEDFGIPLYRSTTVTRVIGKKRVEAVMVGKGGEKLQIIPGTETRVPCDSLVLAVGLIPENELTFGAGAQLDDKTGGPVVNEQFETTIPGIFACGNVLHVYDTVDRVVMDAKRVGDFAADYAASGRGSYGSIVLYGMPESVPDGSQHTGEGDNGQREPVCKRTGFCEAGDGVPRACTYLHCSWSGDGRMGPCPGQKPERHSSETTHGNHGCSEKGEN